MTGSSSCSTSCRRLPIPAVYDKAEELLRLITELYAAGLGRVVEVVSEAPATLAKLVDDELVASLLVVHGLHPDSLAARVERALESVRPFLAQHGGDVELLDIDADAGAVLLRLLGSCDGCPSSAVTLQHAVERAIVEAAPEIVTHRRRGAAEARPRACPVVARSRSRSTTRARPRWPA